MFFSSFRILSLNNKNLVSFFISHSCSALHKHFSCLWHCKNSHHLCRFLKINQSNLLEASTILTTSTILWGFPRAFSFYFILQSEISEKEDFNVWMECEGSVRLTFDYTFLKRFHSWVSELRSFTSSSHHSRVEKQKINWGNSTCWFSVNAFSMLKK